MRWLSGRVLDLRLGGHEIETHLRHCEEGNYPDMTDKLISGT